MNDNQINIKKRFLNGDRTMRGLFILSTTIFVVASLFVLYTQIGFRQWREANVINIVSTGEGCTVSRAKYGDFYSFIYEVDGRQYEHRECIGNRNVGSTAQVISYNTANPSESLFNGIIVHQTTAIVVAFLGLVVSLGIVFLPSKKSPK